MNRNTLPFVLVALFVASACDNSSADPSADAGTSGDNATSGGAEDQADTAGPGDAGDDAPDAGDSPGDAPADDSGDGPADGTTTGAEDITGCIGWCDVQQTCDEAARPNPDCVAFCEQDVQTSEGDCQHALVAYNQCVGALTCEAWTQWWEQTPDYPCEAAELAYGETCFGGGKETPDELACGASCDALTTCGQEADFDVCWDMCLADLGAIEDIDCYDAQLTVAYCIAGLGKQCDDLAAVMAGDEGNMCSVELMTATTACPPA